MKKELEKKRGVFEKVAGSGVWWIQYFDSDGRRRREMVGSRSAAIKLVEKRRTDAHAGVKMPENFRAKPVKFLELAKDALAWSRAEKKSFRFDELRMKVLVAEVGDKAAEQITAGDIRRWLDSKASEWSLATRNRYIALLKMVYRQAMEHERIKTNPAGLVRQKRENNECIRELSPSEEARLRAVIEKSYSDHLPEFEIGLQTGMRLSEEFSLTTWEPLSTGRVSLVKVPRWFEHALADAGFDRHAPRQERVTWHSLRHTFISRLVRAGVDLRTVMELAGHKTIQMTMRYAHLAPGHVKSAIEKMCEASATTTGPMPQRPPSRWHLWCSKFWAVIGLALILWWHNWQPHWIVCPMHVQGKRLTAAALRLLIPSGTSADLRQGFPRNINVWRRHMENLCGFTVGRRVRN